MARIPIATRDNVPASQQGAFDELFPDGSAPQHGPGSVLAHVPELSSRSTALTSTSATTPASPRRSRNSPCC